jgi:hypothetical protein
MKIINPIFKIQNEDRNIFTLRRLDYENILPLATQILEPVKEIGFDITELDLRDSRFSSGELSKTLKQSLVIRLQKGTHNIDISIFVPKIVDNNYIIINGRKKIPLFQLFDIPVVTRGDNIKLRTNVATMMVFQEKEEPKIYVSFLGKKVPMALLMLAYYGADEMKTRFSLDTYQMKDPTHPMEMLLWDLKLFWEESKGYTQDDFILDVGRVYSRYNAKSKGEDIIYALDLIPKIDPITTKFLETGSLLEELMLAMQTGFIDDTLFTNKRARCFEYMIFAKLSKIVFDLCFSNRTARHPKFNISSTQILSECNVSDIVQFDFSINPIEELTKLSRISLLGPGGFKRENIPRHLRDITPSMYGRICPVDTPDRDNCGVLQNLIPNVHLDENLRFSPETLQKQPISIPVSMVPFCEHDDQTRLQMSSSQMRQSILLKEFDHPMIQSGCESLYTDFTQFIKRAKKNGEVVYIDTKYLIVSYEDDEVEVFDIAYRKIYVEHMDFMNVYVKPGDKFKAGDILAESNFCKDGSIRFGKNLLTGVMVYYGNNYEDGIVISDRLVEEDVLTSVHFKDLSFTLPPHKVLLSLSKYEYRPLPNEFSTIQTGNPYAIIKSLNLDDMYSVFGEDIKLNAEKTYIIPEVNIYANEWNEDIPEFRDWVESRIETQKEKAVALKKILADKMGNDTAKKFIKEQAIDKFSFIGKYKMKKEKINGIHIEMYGVHFRKIKVGDKIANRHGNKGVISRIVPREKMPRLDDGRPLDVCINPLGIISRMNIGQLFELQLSMSLYDLRQQLLQMLKDEVDQSEIKNYLLKYIDIIDKTEDKWYVTQFATQIPKTITEDFVNELTLIQPPFESCKLEDVKKALAYTNTNFKQRVYDPLSKDYINNPIAAGYIYFIRMVHIAEEKIAARGIGAYAKRTLQPLGGRKNKGGQRCGEMETACIIGHDAPINLFEFFTTKSDCIEKKNAYIRGFIDENAEEPKDIDSTPESVKLLNSYLTVLGVDHK